MTFEDSGTGRELKKTHSRNSGTGREWKKSIPEIREREGNGKNPFPKFGNGKGMKKNPFPKFGNGKGMKKIHSQNSGRESEASILGNDREREFPLTPDCCSPTELLREFETLMNLLLELWPKFLSSVLPLRSGGLRRELGYNVADTGEMVPKKSSKKRSSGGGSFQPLLGLRETADLQAEVTTWQTELEKCTAHLSIVQPEFCDAI